MTVTIRHGLPLLSAGQAQKEVTHNEALLAIDRQLHLAIVTRGLSAPPPAPVAGASYIVAATAVGAWAGRESQIATHDGAGWAFTAPVVGCIAWIADEAACAVYTGIWSVGGWPATGLSIGGRSILAAAPAVIANPVGGAIVDAEVRAVLSGLISALRAQGVVL